MDYKKFIKAGRAWFTIENTLTGNRFTYKVRKHRLEEWWFVRVLVGSDNVNNYKYLGMIYGDEFKTTRASNIGPEADSFKCFEWLNDHLDDDIPSHIEINHVGRCGRCGRVLTVPASIKTGIGPECWMIIYGKMRDTKDREQLKSARKLLRAQRELKKLAEGVTNGERKERKISKA